MDYEFYNTDGIAAELHGRTAKTANIGIAIRQMPYSRIILGVKTRLKKHVSSGSDFPSEAMLWIKVVEMVDSLDELKSARSVCETCGIAERAVRRVKEGTSAVLLQSGLDNEWWADSMEC